MFPKTKANRSTKVLLDESSDPVDLVADCGADPTGSENANAAFDIGISLANAKKKALHLPNGTFIINRTVSVRDDTAAGNQRGLVIYGEGDGTDSSNGLTCIKWTGNSIRASGTGAAMSAISGSPPIATLTGLTGHSASVGDYIRLSGDSDVNYVGVYQVTEVVSSSSVKVIVPISSGTPAASVNMSWWTFAPDPMLAILSRGCKVEGIRFEVDSGCSVLSAVDVNWSPRDGAVNATNNTFADINVFPNAGTMLLGFNINNYIPGVGYKANGEFYRWHHVYVQDVLLTAFYCPNDTGQTKQHRYEECSVVGNSGGTRSGWFYSKGSFTTKNCTCGGVRDSVLVVGSTVDTLLFEFFDIESCARLMRAEGAANNYWAIVFQGGRIDMNTDLTTGTPATDFIRWRRRGGLIFIGVGFEANDASPGFTMVGVDSTSPDTSQVMMLGCSIPGGTSFFKNFNNANHAKSLLLLGCNATTTDGLATPTTMNQQFLIAGRNGSAGGAYPTECLELACAIQLDNLAFDPATPTAGGKLYVRSGALKYIGSSGTITTIAPA